MEKNNTALAMRVSTNTLIGNAALSAGKLIVGLTAHSGALVADAVHSASDVVSTLVVMIGLRISGKEADPDHPYGHERFESVCGAVLAVMLMATGLMIGYNAIRQIVDGTQLMIPGVPALIAAAVSVAVKEGMYHYTIRAARQLRSQAMKADAWHHRSDALSSVGSFVGILGARFGVLWLDSAASVVICLCILKVSFDILRDSLRGMVDTACDQETRNRMTEVISGVPGVCHIDLLNTRLSSNRIWVDVEIAVDGSMPLRESHAIAEAVHDAVEANFTDVKHCMVHVNPARETGE